MDNNPKFLRPRFGTFLSTLGGNFSTVKPIPGLPSNKTRAFRTASGEM
jgi:hypothetical protein